jgi:phosphoribosylglycinamide formyltransferase-1
LEPAKFSSKEQWADLLLHSIQYHKPDLVVLAGFMRILPATVVKALAGKIINIHPSLLPAFPGAHAVRDALAAGVAVTGATVHLVDEGVDTGPVIRQTEIAIPAGISEPELHSLIKEVEKNQLVEVVREIAEGRLNLSELTK